MRIAQGKIKGKPPPLYIKTAQGHDQFQAETAYLLREWLLALELPFAGNKREQVPPTPNARHGTAIAISAIVGGGTLPLVTPTGIEPISSP